MKQVQERPGQNIIRLTMVSRKGAKAQRKRVGLCFQPFLSRQTLVKYSVVDYLPDLNAMQLDTGANGQAKRND